MPSTTSRHGVAGLLGLLLAAKVAWAAPFMIVGNDEKVLSDDKGKPIISPTGNDTVQIIDVAKPMAPKIVATLRLENSIVGPPVNLAIAPDNSIALVADSMTVVDDNGTRKMVPTDKLFVIDLKSQPPKLVQTLTLGKQPSGLSFSPDGKIALVCNRGEDTISELKIAGTQVTPIGTIKVAPGVSAVEFTHDGKHALTVESPENHVAVLDVDGDKVTYDKLEFPTYMFPYNVIVTPNSKLAITADNGFHGTADGNMDAVSVIDLQWPHPHVIAHITMPDAPEGMAMSPKGDLAVVASVQASNNPAVWFYHKTGVVTVLRIQGQKVVPIKQINVGRVPEAIAFHPDGRYIYVGNFTDEDFSILKVANGTVVDTGKRFKVGGHPASARMSAH
ncbi:MAG TPA: beta-propeller fold lactonase family protein [Acetobacteraceae bacterium]|jgi:DNA-binding beta-propeller fold protein YncE|nr:beta-propeller fold lactonase family protein [Acetobacteraceae bacterium]